VREPRDALTDRRVTRALFAAMVFVVPMPFYMLFIIGWVPLACTIAKFLPLLVVALLGGGFGAAIFAAIVLAVHIAVDGGLLYLGAAFLFEVLFWPRSTRFAYVGVAVLVAIGIVASSFPIYGGMDGGVEVMNVSGVWWQFVLNQPPASRRRVHYGRPR